MQILTYSDIADSVDIFVNVLSLVYWFAYTVCNEMISVTSDIRYGLLIEAYQTRLYVCQ